MKSSFKTAVILCSGIAIGAVAMSLQSATDVKAASASGSDMFSMTTVPVDPLNNNLTEAVFVLDHLNGTLRGGHLNSQTGKFAFTYVRNVAADFAVNAATPEPKYVIVGGPLNAQAKTASGVLYIGELSSGAVIAYTFAPPRGRGGANMAILPMDRLNFREAIGR